MLGPPKMRCLGRPVPASLEALVPPDHFYRHLEAALDLGFVRAWVAGRYAARGRPSIDPVVFFTLQLILFFEGLRSERQLIATASLNLAHRWYLGYHLDKRLPDHSSLTKIRERYGLAIFPMCFIDAPEAARLHLLAEVPLISEFDYRLGHLFLFSLQRAMYFFRSRSLASRCSSSVRSLS